MQQATFMDMKIDAIVVGERVRRDLGDLSGLKQSILQNGIVCPIAVTPGNELIYGERRLRSAEELGLESVPVVVLRTPSDDAAYRDMELAENTHRKPFTISERIRIVDQMEPQFTAIKDRLRIGRLKGDANAIQAAQTELGQLMGRQVDNVPKLRSILAEIAELGERAAQRAREIVHAFDKLKTEELRGIVAYMDATGDVHGAFEKYLETLPVPVVVKKSTPFYESEGETGADGSFYESAPPAPPTPPVASAGKRFEDVLDDAAAHPAKPNTPAKKDRKPSEPIAPAATSAPTTPHEPNPTPAATTRKERGKDREVRPEGERLDIGKLESLYGQWVKTTLKRLHEDDRERAAEILSRGFQQMPVASDEIYDAASAVQKVAAIIDSIEPDFRNEMLCEVAQIIMDHGATIDSRLHANDAEALQQVVSQLEAGVKQLRKRETWAGCAPDVRQFIRKGRRLLLQFEKHAAVGSEPDRSLFEGDNALPPHLDNEEFLAVFAEWWDDRRKRKLSITDSVRKKQLKLLGFGDAEQATAIVLKAIENQWKGIPDDIWSASWNGRDPAHAPDSVLQKIQASRPKGSAYKRGEDMRRSASDDRSTFRDDE